MEGMIIAGYTVGASYGIIYLRGEYRWLVNKLEDEIQLSMKKVCWEMMLVASRISILTSASKLVPVLMCVVKKPLCSNRWKESAENPEPNGFIR